MGYSYTARAGLVLDAIQERLQVIGVSGSNGMPGGGFWETGREQRDGAITGTVWKPWDKDPTRVVRRGSFRIDAEGQIIRFPGLAAHERRMAEAVGAAKYRHMYTRPMFEVVQP